MGYCCWRESRVHYLATTAFGPHCEMQYCTCMVLLECIDLKRLAGELTFWSFDSLAAEVILPTCSPSWVLYMEPPFSFASTIVAQFSQWWALSAQCFTEKRQQGCTQQFLMHSHRQALWSRSSWSSEHCCTQCRPSKDICHYIEKV